VGYGAQAMRISRQSVLLAFVIGGCAASCFAERAAAQAPVSLPRLEVAPGGRYLQTEDGRPFLYLADTAWQLFHRLTLEEAEFYLRNRREKGFTVIQAVVLAELGGIDVPNANGHLPLHGRDPGRPNELYFQDVDRILEVAQELGLYVAMLPTWGSYWKVAGEDRPRLFDPAKARSFGRYLGERYRDRPVIWVLGGDQNIDNGEERDIVEAMARGLEEGDGGRHLMTYHPRGPGRSSDYFHHADWLDFNMVQSSHAARDHDNGLFIEHDRRLIPAKPTLDGEPRYEALMVGFYLSGAQPAMRFDDYDVRQAAYWAMLSGACGHTYGHNSVWQMWDPRHASVIGADIPWREALDHPGAAQMRYLRRLLEARPFHLLVPEPRLIPNGPNWGGAKIRGAISSDGSFALVYSPRGEPFAVDRSRLQAKRLRESWYDPRYGTVTAIHTGDTSAIQTYQPPCSGRGSDWVLILDDADVGLPFPLR
jgi:hypothetical protein